jgi:hypothetical protein
MVSGAMNRKVMQDQNIANAVTLVGTLEHFIWSSLPSASTASGGKLAVPYMDGKAEIDEYILKFLPGLADKTTFLWGGFYAENVQYPSFVPNFLASAEKYVWVQAVGAETLVPMVGDYNANMGDRCGESAGMPGALSPKKVYPCDHEVDDEWGIVKTMGEACRGDARSEDKCSLRAQ